MPVNEMNSLLTVMLCYSTAVSYRSYISQELINRLLNINTVSYICRTSIEL